MKCLVTGGAGFIGSHLVDLLLEYGNEVVVVDDLSEGKRENTPTYVHDVSILNDIEYLFPGIDVVFHLAAYTRPQGSIAMPVYSNKVNVEGTLRVLACARNWGVRRVVFASSASVYGEQPLYPVPEVSPLNPMSPYAVQKIVGEMYCKLFHDLYGLEYNVLRLFNTYGPRQNPSGEYAAVIPKFMQQVRNGEQPTIYGTGEQRRDFIHVSDVASAFVLAGTSLYHGETFDVGTGENVSVKELLGVICEVIGKKADPAYGPAQVEPTQTLADTGRIYNVLGWEAKVELREGLWSLKRL